MNISGALRFVFRHFLVLLVLILVAAVLMNTSPFDEELLPILQARENREVHLDPDTNAFTVLFGIDAAAGKSASAVGMQIIGELKAKAAAGDPIHLSNERMAAIKGIVPDQPDWQEPYAAIHCNPRLEIDCAARLVDEVRKQPPDGEEVMEQLDRYRSLVQMSQFSEMIEGDFSTNLPAYQDALQLGRLFVAQAYAKGDPVDFLDALSDDMAFWRMMLRDGSTLIAKMVANAGIRTDLQFISHAIAEGAINDGTQFDALLIPLSPDVTDIGESFWAEQDVVFVEIDKLDSGLKALITQPNATKNAYYRRHTEPLLLLAKMDPVHFSQQAPRVPGSDYRLGSLSPNPYNIGGRLVISMFAGSYYDYIGRIHDLDGLIGLVRLYARASVSDSPESMLSRQTEVVDPFSGRPVAFDAQARLLGFQCYQGYRNKDRCEIKIR